MSHPPLFRCEELQTAFSPRIDLDLPPKGMFGLRGPSGCGKTTLLLAMADLAPHRGRCLLEGRPAMDFRPEAWRRRVLYTPPASRLRREPFPELLHSDRAGTLAKRLGIDGELKQERSSGEDQRLLLLRSLLLEPSVLLLDEMGAHMDPEGRGLLCRVVREWLQQDGRGVIWVSHNREVLEACDTVIEMEAPVDD